jgi:hypothetical protein
MHCEESERSSAIKAIGSDVVQQMLPQAFHTELRSMHIVIADNNHSHIECNRHGLMALNSLKELVNIEGAHSFPF